MLPIPSSTEYTVHIVVYKGPCLLFSVTVDIWIKKSLNAKLKILKSKNSGFPTRHPAMLAPARISRFFKILTLIWQAQDFGSILEIFPCVSLDLAERFAQKWARSFSTTCWRHMQTLIKFWCLKIKIWKLMRL